MSINQVSGSTVRHQVIIIGAGFSGINMAIQLRQAGIDDFIVLERAQDVGGTWRDNTYPGCACDVPSILYSYSFEQKPDWSAAFAGFREIHRYIQRCVDKYGIRDHVRLGVEVAQADFDAASKEWVLQDRAGNRYQARAVVCATGGLVNPAEPAIPGRSDFKGRIVHTAQWDSSLDLRGKRVAVIGTGASAIQVIPAIQKDVGSLAVFQRTAPWVLPKPEGVIGHLMKFPLRESQLLRNAVRRMVFIGTEALLGPVTTLDTPLSSALEMLGKRHLYKAVKNPALRMKLTPNFRIGCKRILLSNNYYPALSGKNVTVISNAIKAFDSAGIITSDNRHHDVDIIIMATGFRTDIGRAPFAVNGPDGTSLEAVWSAPGKSKAYKGVAVSGFPNWFIMLGPNTGPGHTSVLVYTEAQARYILQGIKLLINGSIKALSIKDQVQSAYGKKLQSRMKRSSWSTGCTSWYLDENGENHALFPGLASEYVISMRKFEISDYTTS